MFGIRLRDARKNKGLTLDEVAEIYNRRYNGKINKSTLSRYENDLQEPMISVVQKLASVLNVSVDYLIGKDSRKEKREDNFITYPVVVGIKAGFDGEIVFEESGDSEQIPTEWIRGDTPDKFFVAKVHGDSMYPMFLDGDRVLVRVTPSVDSGSICAIRINGNEITLKRVVYKQGEDWLELQPINTAYPPKRIEGADLSECGFLIS